MNMTTYVSPVRRSKKLVICSIQKDNVSVRQNRKKNRPPQCLESARKIIAEGIVHVKNAARMIIAGPCHIIRSVFAAIIAIQLPKLITIVVFQEYLGSNSRRNNIITWNMDRRKDISLNNVIILNPFSSCIDIETMALLYTIIIAQPSGVKFFIFPLRLISCPLGRNLLHIISIYCIIC